ncbi:hypothetical protein [Lyngbya sp. PCC 8106]|nr:hypothetical protein [Lyngbya sp. PCC 8106]
MHYIPYRTYNRLTRDNNQCEKNNKNSSGKCDRTRQKVS